MSERRQIRGGRLLIGGVMSVLVLALAGWIGAFALRSPAVVQVTPADGLTKVNPNGTIEIEFNQWLSAPQVMKAVRFDPPVGFDVTTPGFPWPGRTKAIIRPKGGLQNGTRYRLTISQDATNLIGRAIEQPLAVAFDTLPFITVKSVAPSGGQTDVALRTPITVEFNEPVVTAEQVAAAAQDPSLANELPQPLSIQANEPAGQADQAGEQPVGRWLSPTLYSFAPGDGLRGARTYTVTLSNEVNPQGGALLDKPLVWSFGTTAALLESTRPFDGAINVPASSEVEVRLAPEVDLESAKASFGLQDVAQAQPVAGTITVSERRLLFKPSAPLVRGVRYEARLAPGVRTTTGKALNGQPLIWSFSVIGDLAIDQVAPAANTTEVLTTTKRISVRFNHPVVALTTIEGQKTLPQPITISPALPGEGRWIDTQTYIFSPTTSLAPSTKYEVTVAAGLKDQTEGSLGEAYRWSFQTITPLVRDTIPQPGMQYAAPNQPVRILFNQPMDQASLEQNVRLVAVNGQTVAGSLTAAGANALFTPSAPLQRGGSYTLVVAQGTRAAIGTGTISTTVRHTFRVAPLPQVQSMLPGNGTNDARAGSNSLEIRFSTPMDWGSVSRNLVIEPKPTGVYTSGYDINYSMSLNFQPETDYRVTLRGTALDPFGVALGQDVSVSFRTGSLPPSFALVSNNPVATYNAYVPVRVPLRHVGTPSVSYSLHQIDPAQAVLLINNYDLFRQFVPSPASLIKEDTINLEGGRNQERLDVLGIGQVTPGMYYFRLRGPGELLDHQIMVVSRYALTLKRSPDQLFLWAVDLADGKPVANLPLQVVAPRSYDDNGKPITTPAEPTAIGATDSEGVLRATFQPFDSSLPVFVWAGDNERFAFTTTNWGEGISPWDYGLASELYPTNVVGNIATDRPIYRPEQTVYVRGVLRELRDERYLVPDAGQQARVRIEDSTGNQVMSTTVQISEFGSFNTSLALASNAPLGTYNLSFQLLNGDRQSVYLYGSFAVAEYRKPVFEITVQPNQPDVIQGQKLTMQVAAKYFSGGVVANAPIRWRVLGAPLYWQSAAAPNYQFENLEDAYASYRWFESDRGLGGRELISEGTARTDAQGNFQMNVPAALGKEPHSRTLTFDVEITDIDGQVIAAQGAANVHVGAFYVGLRPEGYVAQVGQPQNVAVVALDLQEKPVANQALEVKVFRREWFSAREKGTDGRLYWTSRFTDTLVDTQAVTTDAQGRGSFAFTPKDGGSYRLQAEGRDADKHVITSSAYSWAYGGDTFWGVNDTNRIDLIADQGNYKPGDTAKILLPAPYKGMTALMTIERGQVIEHRVFTLQGTTDVLEVPITAAFAPNVYVSVVLIKAAGEDLPVPDLRMGLINLPVSTEQQELKLTLTPDKAEAGPGDEVTYTLKATDYQGQGVRAEVGLALADKAALALADDPNPTLRQSFYEKRPLGVYTAQSLTVLVDRLTLKLQPGNKGGGGGLAADVLLRRNFPDTAYWNPAVVTDATGTAQVKVKLPDNLTTWRMTARGLTTATQVGQTTNDLMATRPLLIRPTLPRFLTVGDKLTVQAVIQNNTTEAIKATATFDPGSLKLGVPSVQAIEVPANGQVLLRWPAEVPTAGPTTLKFTVQGAGLEDGIEHLLPIQRFTTPEAVASGGQVQSNTIETIKPVDLAQATDAAMPNVGEVEVELVPSLAAGVQTTLAYLRDNTSSCAESIVSQFLPNVATYRLFKQLGKADPALTAEVERELMTNLQRLYGLQELDGGWGWCGDHASQPYLTAYALHGLVEARRAGFTVDERVYNAALGYIEQVLDTATVGQADAPWFSNERSLLDMRSYALFVLAEAGRPDRGRTTTLYAERAKLSIAGRSYLLMTLKTLQINPDWQQTLVNDLMSSALLQPTDAHWEEAERDPWTLSNNTRTTALALQALVRTSPTNALIPNAVRYVMRVRDQNRWESSHTSALVLLALGEYLAQSDELAASYSYRVALDGKTLGEGAIDSTNLNTPIKLVIKLAEIKAQGSQIALQRQAASGQSGKGRLYYTLRMRSYQDAAAVQALDQGLVVERSYSAVNSQTLTATGELITQAKLGDVVEVRLRLDVPTDMHYLTVEDMLPAGLEALDGSLKTTSTIAEAPELTRENERPFWWYFSQSEIRDNRVALFAATLPKGTYIYTYLARATTPGNFQTLPATGYQTYAPEVFGRSAGALFTVTAP